MRSGRFVSGAFRVLHDALLVVNAGLLKLLCCVAVRWRPVDRLDVFLVFHVVHVDIVLGTLAEALIEVSDVRNDAVLVGRTIGTTNEFGELLVVRATS